MSKLHLRIMCGILCGAVLLGMSGCSKNTDNTGKDPGQTANAQVRYEDYIFVGDSRFVGMKEATAGKTDTDIRYVAEVGQGLAWLKKTAPELYGESGKTIIFNLGVNDLYNISGYIDFYNGMPQEFIENNTLVIMTVNPVDEQKEAEYGYAVTNAEIEQFNSKMKTGVDSLYFKMIDSYTYVTMSAYKTVDGIHYTSDTYGLIFDYAVECCSNRNYMKR